MDKVTYYTVLLMVVVGTCDRQTYSYEYIWLQHPHGIIVIWNKFININ